MAVAEKSLVPDHLFPFSQSLCAEGTGFPSPLHSLRPGQADLTLDMLNKEFKKF